jgi:hypothetical protein
MVIVVACGVAVSFGLVAIWRWGAIDAHPPPDAGAVDRYVWNLNVALAAGLSAGALIGGPGGRLAMRLLAATAGDAAQGHLTEADEVVGRITTNGTLGFMVFVGLAGGVLSGVVYVLIRRWLPAGRVGGLVFGALLLAVFAPHLDPLRRNNPDFDLVGPAWLALVVFSALLLVHGMAVAAFVARYRSTLRPFSKQPRVMVRYLTLFPLIVPILAGAALCGGIVTWIVSRRPALVTWLRSRAVLVWGRVALVAGTLVAMPAFVLAVTDIAGRGP